MTDLVFTSELALKRSIRQKYPKMDVAQWKATFNDQKKFIGIDTEEYLDMKWKEYKETHDINGPSN